MSRLRADILRLLPELATYIPAPTPYRPDPPVLRPIPLSPLPDDEPGTNLLSLRHEPTRVLRADARNEYFAHGLSLRRFQQLSSSVVPAANGVGRFPSVYDFWPFERLLGRVSEASRLAKKPSKTFGSLLSSEALNWK
jgi:hypothetical protein